ncbi:mycothiol conjugate amidase Mca [Enemella sp. A6]|uniref:mycothiol conjugate amidase Mca n=1 Tax=Enemella sp. A6 TaxID=3440152 RepID=UPI003EB7A312
MTNHDHEPAALRVDAAGERLRLLCVHAHPDDESSKGAATMAMYREQGVEVVVATCTGGERGSILNPAMDRPDIITNLPEVRRREMEAARDILGVEQVWLGFVDSGLPEGDPLPPLPEGCFALLDPEEGARPLVELIRRFRPHVVVTYDENGGYPHPDHIMTHTISMLAIEQAADEAHRPEAGPAWQVLKTYYQFSFHYDRYAALDAEMRLRDMESVYADRLKDWERDEAHQARVTTKVPCSDWFEVRDRALLAHATQIDPNGFWFAVPLEVQAAAWPTEDYELVDSQVPTELPEDDLFAGIAEPLRYDEL